MPDYWLLKSEPSTFSIEDLARSPKRTTCWEGVRNYQARNFLRAMAVGDLAFFYHSNADPPAIMGIVEVVKAAYPDYFAWRPGSHYFDEKSSKQNPRWVMVIRSVERGVANAAFFGKPQKGERSRKDGTAPTGLASLGSTGPRTRMENYSAACRR